MERSKEYSQSSVFLVCGPRDGRGNMNGRREGYELQGNTTGEDGNAVMRYTKQDSHVLAGREGIRIATQLSFFSVIIFGAHSICEGIFFTYRLCPSVDYCIRWEFVFFSISQPLFFYYFFIRSALPT